MQDVNFFKNIWHQLYRKHQPHVENKLILENETKRKSEDRVDQTHLYQVLNL